MVFAPTAVLAVGGTNGNVSGVVHDTAGNPVADVNVFAASGSGSYKATTDAKGQFTLLGLPADTYTISFEKANYQTTTAKGITVSGDSTVNLGTISVSRATQTIGRVTSRSANSAYQPSVTVDTTTLSGQRISQALGVATSTNEAQLLRAAPSVDFSTSGNVAIRGSLAVELGYQFDGVNFASPFFDENAGAGQVGRNQGGYLNGFGAGAGGSVQVVSGSGDATQGNIGAGVINIVPPRGTYPPGGLASYTFGTPGHLNQYDLDYGIASKDGSLSNYIAYNHESYGPYPGPNNATAADENAFYGTSNTTHYDLLDNFFYRFGKNHNQSVQFLYRTLGENQYGNLGGTNGVSYYPYNPVGSAYFDPYGVLAADGLYDGSQAGLTNFIKSSFPNLPYYNGQQFLTQPEQIETTNSSLVKVGYTATLGASTFLSADYYSLNTQQTQEYYSVQGAAPAFSQTGGARVGFDLNITEQFGTSHTVTVASKYEIAKPRWFQLSPTWTPAALSLTQLLDPSYQANISDFAVPNAAGVCPAGPTGCYVYNALLAKGLIQPGGAIPTLPVFGIDYHNSSFLSYGVGIRDQWQVTPKLKLDYGLREDGGTYKFGPQPLGSPTQIYSNPSDLGSAQLTPAFLTPNIIQPRFALSYQLTPNDTIRGSYGRSVELAFAQTAGTPFNVSNLSPLLSEIPAKDSAATPACGSGFNNLGVKGYSKNPDLATAGSGYFFQCANYAQQVFWAADQVYDAPDYGGAGQPTFSNYDVAYMHQFAHGALAGWGTNVTAYWRRGFNSYQNVLVTSGPPDPVTGQSSASVFQVLPGGNEKTFGIEAQITTPDRPSGFSGFLSASYLASYSTQPPASNGNTGVSNGNFASDTLTAILLAPLYNTGVYFRSAVLPPFQVRVGAAYTTKGGFKINPIFSANSGQPFGNGSTTIATINSSSPIFIPTSNFGVAGPVGGANAANQAYNSNEYVDPALPGSYLKPNIAATRGYNEAKLAGGNLTNPQSNIDLDLEWAFGESRRNVVGMYVSNLMDVHYTTPYYNTKWQPVSTGTGGPQTGQQNTSPDPYSSGYANYQAGIRDQPSFAGGYTPFSYAYNTGTTFQFYLQRKF